MVSMPYTCSGLSGPLLAFFWGFVGLFYSRTFFVPFLTLHGNTIELIHDASAQLIWFSSSIRQFTATFLTRSRTRSTSRPRSRGWSTTALDPLKASHPTTITRRASGRSEETKRNIFWLFMIVNLCLKNWIVEVKRNPKVSLFALTCCRFSSKQASWNYLSK